MNTSPLISISSGKFFETIRLGISFIVFKFSVMSSPSFPSPLDRPVVNLPFLKIKDAEIPSILGSALYSITCDRSSFKKLKMYRKVFFYNGLFFGYGYFLLSMYWVSHSIIEFDTELFYIAPIIFFAFPLCLAIFFGLMQLVNAYYLYLVDPNPDIEIYICI